VPTPVVALNRAVAVAMAGRVDDALAVVEALGSDPASQANHLYHSARADLLVRCGRTDEAVAAYGRALDLATTTAERRFIAGRLERYARPSNSA
jgi:RNA polymerase sigma-70 factor (ECF subfamily)